MSCWRGRLNTPGRQAPTIKRLITFTFNIVSQGLYIRHGLLPRLPIYLVGADRDVVMLRRQGELAQLDVITLGVSREKHHHYF